MERLIRFKPHTLGKNEEELLAMQGEMAQAASRAFRQLHDADLKFGFVTNENGEQIELSNATFAQLLHSPKRTVRREAFHQYYAQFAAHENTLAATLNGSILKDVYYARARATPVRSDASLFPDNVPRTVYDNLIDTVHRHLPAVHHYYEVRRRKMRLKDIHLYDTYVPILSELEVHRTWDQAVHGARRLSRSVATIAEPWRQGLHNRWCDRYPNLGKQSGAFSCGSYDANPYILMNYKPQVLDDVFTLAHEAGHSMHSYLSAHHQPFRLLRLHDLRGGSGQYVQRTAAQRPHAGRSHAAISERAYLINREVDGIRGTIIRQTMFAEFEKLTHALAESGEPLTVQALEGHLSRTAWSSTSDRISLLDPELSLECLRIPHFYRAFYVYKYATGLSAAIALSQRVLGGGHQELGGLSGLPPGRLFQGSARPAPRCGCRYGQPRAGQHGARTLRTIGAAAG